MKKVLAAGLFLAALLVVSAQAGTGEPQPNKVKQTAGPIWTLAIDGPRVAYASGGRVYVWNVMTGATSVVKGTYSNAKHTDNAAEIAIAGKRVAWVKRQQIGNTEQPQRLYTAPVGGSATRLRRVLGYTDMGCGPGGSQIAGLVGSGNVLAVSTWKSSSDGMVPANERLNLVTRTGLRPIATGPATIVSASADRGRIAVVPLPKPVWNPAEGYCDLTAPTSVAVYSVDGTLLQRIETGGPVAEVALSGNLLVVLPGTSTPTFKVYDWTTATLLHTWPVTKSPFDFAVSGQLAVYSLGYRRQSGNPNVHLLSLTTGKEVAIATTTNSRYCDLAIGRRGLVYAVNPFKNTRRGKLVFVPTAKLLAALSK
jgi:WD40 repeat protein